MEESRPVPSPTRPKTKSSESSRNGTNRATKGMEEAAHSSMSKVSQQRPQRSSQSHKALKNVSVQSADSGSSNLMRPLGDAPRRTKSNPGHFNLINASLSQHSTGQVAAPSHTAAIAASSSNKLQPPAAAPAALSLLATSLPAQSLSGMTTPSVLGSHDLSPNLSHKATMLSTQHLAKKPPLASHVSVPAPQPQHLDAPRQRMLERANKARLYFLRQSGPNKFLIGGDSYDSRFHVNIGPQVCSCNKSHCVHLLFVMLRVLKVKQSSPMLWAKTLRNYEVESLLKEFQDRVMQRSATPRKSKKKFDFLRRSHDSSVSSSGRSQSGRSTPGTAIDELSPPVSPGGAEVEVGKGASPGKLSNSSPQSDTHVEEGEGAEPEREDPEGGDSDKEEDVCPICLNELDEGEDLLICPGCNNHLHQHCMDIWAMEERRKNKNKVVHCPVCRASWPMSGIPSASDKFSPEVMPVSVPVAGEPASGKGPGAGGSVTGGGVISEEKAQLLLALREVFGNSSSSSRMDSLFSSDWRARETALNDIAREAISLLLPHSSATGDHTLSGIAVESSIGGRETPPRVECRRVQEVCAEVIRHSCADSVLKVFLAALDLLKVVMVYSPCPTKHDSAALQELLKPVVSCLLTRCADAQKRVKECSIEATRNLCLGQEGPLSVGSARGHLSTHPTTNLQFVFRVAFSGPDRSENSWRWWLGRLNFMDNILSQFSHEFLLSQAVTKPPARSGSSFGLSDDGDSSGHSSGMVSPSDSITSSAATSVMSESVNDSEVGNSDTDGLILRADELGGLSEQFLKMDINYMGSPPVSIAPVSLLPDSPALQAAVEGNLLMQAWFFAAHATHIPQRKLGRVARRVIIRIAKILRDNPSSLEVAHAVVAQCHRTQAEGLLDRVLQARENSYGSTSGHANSGKEDRAGRIGRRLNMDADESRDDKARSPSRSATPKASVESTGSSEPKLSLGISKPKIRSLSPSAFPNATPQLSSSPIMSKKSLQRDSADNSSGGSWIEDDTPRPEVGGARSLARSTSHSSKKGMSRQRSRQSVKNAGGASDELVDSDESFRSALSDFDPDCSNETVVLREALEREREEGEGSSGSHDSRRSYGGRDKQQSSASSGSGNSGGRSQERMGPLPGFVKSSHPHLYMRQSTADSVFSTDSTDTDGSGWGVYACKHNIEQEEAEDLARVRSMEVQDVPHPSLSLAPSTTEVLIHVQASKNKTDDETDQASVGKPYLEGVHWVKGKLIGTGAFCSCYLARDMENGTMFAVKQVSFARNTEAQEAEELSRLKDEVAMLGRINHPNIVRCLGATQHDRHINIFIEWMAGGCLDQLLHDFGRFGESVICNYTKQITRGIVFLHEKDIIHRDLKGGNILVDSTGQKLRIADFGAAARLATHNTGSGEFQNMEGTVAFMAPEVVKGGTEEKAGYGRKCDVWSIGCVIIQMATSKPPWDGTYDPKVKFQLIFKIGQATGPPPMPEFSNPALKDFVLRCLEVNPKDRPTSAELLRHPLYRL